MTEESSVLRILTEDILRILGEKGEKASLKTIKSEIKAGGPPSLGFRKTEFYLKTCLKERGILITGY